MIFSRTRLLRAPLFWLGLILLASACGKKSPPLAPERLRPRAVTDLTARNVEDGIRLRWRLPTDRAAGGALDVTPGMVLLRTDGATQESCESPAATWERVLTFAPGAVTPPTTWVDTAVVSGRWYGYRAHAVGDDGSLSDASTRAIVFRGEPPPQPPAPVLRSGDGFLVLEAPPFPPDVIGWTYYRSATDAPFPPIPSYGGVITGNAWTDGQVVNGQTVRYAIAWIGQTHGFVLEGPMSPPVEGMPVDLVPPPRPGSIVAVPRDGAVDIRWQRVEEPDVRYHVYRRRLDLEPGFTRITAGPLPDNVLEDRPRRGQYLYAVTSIDRSGNESSRSEPASVTVR